MATRVNKPEINLATKLAQVDKPTGVAGEALLQAETVQEQQTMLNVGRKNFVINGAMEVYQRNASYSGASGYALDRWKLQQDTGVDTTCSQVTVSDDSPPARKGFQKALQIAVTNTSTASNFYSQAAYYFEGYDASRLGINQEGGNHITLSFWVKSSVEGQYYAFVDDAKSGYRFPFGYWLDADTWKYVTVTVPPNRLIVVADDNTAEFRIVIPAFYGTDFTEATSWNQFLLNGWQPHSGSAFTPDFDSNWANTSGATFQITGVQLEIGRVATPFEHRLRSEELALCQRYFCKLNFPQTTPIGPVHKQTTNTIRTLINLPVPMRAEPSINSTGQPTFFLYWSIGGTDSSATNSSGTAFTVVGNSLDNARVTLSAGVGGVESLIGSFFGYSGDLNFDAEL